RGLAVALIKQVFVDIPVLQREASPEQVVRGVRAQYLRRGERPDESDGHADVRDRRLVDDAQFLPRRAVDVRCRLAVVCLQK
ncbi:MAG: hypothetical protein IKX36_02460, partial [Prevotella sp.]|nr:hypothetical protein [Prevotella sp.]